MVFTVASIPVSMLFFDCGRLILIDGATSYLKWRGIDCEIKGIDKNFAKIDSVSIKSPDNFEISTSKIELKKNGIFSKAYIHVNNFIFRLSDNSKSELSFKNPIPFIKTLRTFIKKLHIENGDITVSDKNYSLSAMKYISGKSEDVFSFCLDKKSTFDCRLQWSTFGCKKVDVSFEKFMDCNGAIEINNPGNSFANYKLNINKTNLSVNSVGNIRNNEIIIIKSFNVEHNKKTYSINGDIHFLNDYIFLKLHTDSNNFTEALPHEIKKNFSDTFAKLTAKYFFDKSIKSEFVLDFEKDKTSIGKICGIFKNHQLNINGNLDWINIYGYQLKNLDCEIQDLKKITAKIHGTDFDITLATKIEKAFLIENLIFDAQKSGLIKLINPVFLTAELPTEMNFSFKFNGLDFWDKIIPISGDINGDISYKDGIIKAKGSGNKLILPNTELTNYRALIDGGNVSFTSKNAQCFASKWQNLSFKIADNNLKLTSKANNNSSISADGKISDSFQKISLNQCSLVSDEVKCDTKKCDLDFEKNYYDIAFDVFNKKTNKSGHLEFKKNEAVTQLEFAAFRPNTLGKIFGIWIPKCSLEGTVKFNHSEKKVSGGGQITISELLSGRSSVELNGKITDNKLQLDGAIKSAKNTLRCSAFVPIFLENSGNSGNISKNSSSMPLNCHIFGTTRLEHVFELPDKTDARGLFNCDLKISGSFENPKINGTASLKDGYFVIGDVFLRRGNILLNCYRNNVNVSHAEFVDNQKKKLIATGNGNFFFDGFIPNIKTNLTLHSDNFTLFDSENLNIKIKGDGKISGPINDLLISGSVDVTKCVVRNMGTGDSNQNDGIIIDNEINVSKKHLNDKKVEKDFCRYDIAMHCPKVLVVGDIYEIIFGGDLRLASYDHRATLIGSLLLQKGKLDLFGKRMVMRKGKADFFEQYPFNPNLMLLCKNNFGDMVVYLKIKNSPEKGVTFDLFSVPSQSQETILSHMLFGKDLKYLSVSEAAQFAQAMSSFNQSGGYIFSILNTFKSSGVVDTISFTDTNSRTNSLNTNSQTSEAQKNLNISAGKYIGDNLFISVNKKSDETTSFDIDYSLTPKISVKANTNGEAGISWKYKY